MKYNTEILHISSINTYSLTHILIDSSYL